jgi:hypothetical protein
MAAAFSDHNAAILRLEMDHQANYRGKGYWKMTINMLQEKKHFKKLSRSNGKNGK